MGEWSSPEKLEAAINDYMHFYNNHRIKMSLGGKSIMEYREELGLLSK